MSSYGLSGKTVLITGASSGIGAAAARLFANEGAKLILLGRDAKRLQALKIEIAQASAQAFAFDITNEVALADCFQQIKTLDIAINNAGYEGAIGDITDLTLKDFDEAMNVNVRALWNCMQHEIKYFRGKGQAGTIVNVSSIAGHIALPTSSLYVGAKHAVNGLTKSLAIEQIPFKIRINAVSPGGVETPMLKRIFEDGFQPVIESTPLGRIAKPMEIAEAIVWLASERSSFVVGENLVIDGGRTV